MDISSGFQAQCWGSFARRHHVLDHQARWLLDPVADFLGNRSSCFFWSGVIKFCARSINTLFDFSIRISSLFLALSVFVQYTSFLISLAMPTRSKAALLMSLTSQTDVVDKLVCVVFILETKTQGTGMYCRYGNENSLITRLKPENKNQTWNPELWSLKDLNLQPKTSKSTHWTPKTNADP